MKTTTHHPAALRCFYRPHRRVQFHNECIDYKTGEIINPPSRTEQHHKDSCDINLIVKRMKPHEMQQLIARNAAAGMYTDLPDNTDYQTALDTVREAGHAFDSLPSQVRERFGHDPARFLAFATDPANLQALRDFGLAAPSLPAAVPSAPPAAPTPTAQTQSPSVGFGATTTPPSGASQSTSVPTPKTNNP